MDTKSLKEKAKYDLIWSQYSSYRDFSPGEVFAPLFLSHFKDHMLPGETLIDFGSGTGRASSVFLDQQLKVELVDFSSHALDEQIRHLIALCPDLIHFTKSSLWNLPKSLAKADWIYCTDVLEHIPENQIDKVLKGMATRMKKGGFLSICTQEDQFGKEVGFPLHLTIKDSEWWMEKISRYFLILKQESLLEGVTLLFFVAAL